MAQKGILSHSIDDKQELYRCYMPFLLNGGLFIPTRKRFRLGDEVLVLLTLMGEERMAIPGRVAWLTPARHSSKAAGKQRRGYPVPGHRRGGAGPEPHRLRTGRHAGIGSPDQHALTATALDRDCLTARARVSFIA